MKKVLVFALMFGTLAFAIPQTYAAPAAPEPQWRDRDRRDNRYRNRRYNRNRNNRTWTETRTRMVRSGNRMYRERLRITHYPNGRTRVQVISRTRIR